MTDRAIVVTSVRLERTADASTLSGLVDGQMLSWSTSPRDVMSVRGEPFVAALLVSAMTTGRDLVLPDDAPVDAEFLASMDELQVIFLRWFSGLRHVVVRAARMEPRLGSQGRLAGYSGGIDSSYTVMKLAADLDGVVLFDGIEYGTPNPALMQRVDHDLGAVMAARGLPLLTVRTNVKQIGKAFGGRWSQFIGGSLASVPHAIGAAEYTIAGSNSWENLRPYGTHPVTDPLWSSSTVTIRHHGTDARRIDKMQALAAAPDLLDVVRVCFQGSDYNCGVCQKCLQTSAALRALGLTSAAMPPLVDPQLLRKRSVEHDGDLVDWEEIMMPGLEARDPALHRELRRLVRRYQWRQAFRRVDAMLTGGLARSLLRRAGLGTVAPGLRGGKRPEP